MILSVEELETKTAHSKQIEMAKTEWRRLCLALADFLFEEAVLQLKLED